jgi:stage IV sporulation protein FB
MIQFQLLGFPVRVHWLFWLNTALLGGALGAQSPQQIQRVLIWIAMVFVSILIHELGHALTMRRFGDRHAGIVLYAFGGLAIPSRGFTRLQDIIVSAAGPVLQMLAGLVVWLVIAAFPAVLATWAARQAFSSFLFVSLFWGAFNLVPIIPLDGGRISQALFGPRRQRAALTLSLACAVAAALWFWFSYQALIAAIFLGMLAFNNWQSLNRRPEAPWMNVR